MKMRDFEEFATFESVADDNAWRFELIRSTLEDLERLIADESPAAVPVGRSRTGSRSGQGDVPVPFLTLPRPRLAAMST